MISRPTARTPPAHSKSLAKHQRLVLYCEGKNRLHEITYGISIFLCRNESCLLETRPTHAQEPDTKLTPTLHKTPQKPDIHSANKPTFFIIFLLGGGGRGWGLGNPSFISTVIRSPSLHLQNLNPLSGTLRLHLLRRRHISSLRLPNHGRPTCGPLRYVMRPADTFVNYVSFKHWTTFLEVSYTTYCDSCTCDPRNNPW
jgi:hypothetical protein